MGVDLSKFSKPGGILGVNVTFFLVRGVFGSVARVVALELLTSFRPPAQVWLVWPFLGSTTCLCSATLGMRNGLGRSHLSTWSLNFRKGLTSVTSSSLDPTRAVPLRSLGSQSLDSSCTWATLWLNRQLLSSKLIWSAVVSHALSDGFHKYHLISAMVCFKFTRNPVKCCS